MKNSQHGLCLALLLGLSAPAAFATDQALDGATAAVEERGEIRLIGGPKSAAYRYVLPYTGPNTHIAEEVSISVAFPKGVEIESIGAVVPSRPVVHRPREQTPKNSPIPGGPDPIGSGISLGDRTNTHILGHCFDVGHRPMPGNIQYEWTWQNRVDTDGDNKPDSDPGWVLTGVKIEFPVVNSEIC
ncbi:MAG: hypothetical protein H4O13_17125 [Xanthomonadales bacterium]|nr:hypothetical protein [Xanthomonadales bacterium]